MILNKIYKVFSEPSDFKNDSYGWITNQIGHVSISFLLCYLTGVYLPFLIFWILWEIKHFIKSKNIKDLIEDLFFELGGIVIFLYGNIPLYIIIIITIILFINKVNKIK